MWLSRYRFMSKFMCEVHFASSHSHFKCLFFALKLDSLWFLFHIRHSTACLCAYHSSYISICFAFGRAHIDDFSHRFIFHFIHFRFSFIRVFVFVLVHFGRELLSLQSRERNESNDSCDGRRTRGQEEPKKHISMSKCFVHRKIAYTANACAQNT